MLSQHLIAHMAYLFSRTAFLGWKGCVLQCYTAFEVRQCQGLDVRVNLISSVSFGPAVQSLLQTELSLVSMYGEFVVDVIMLRGCLVATFWFGCLRFGTGYHGWRRLPKEIARHFWIQDRFKRQRKSRCLPNMQMQRKHLSRNSIIGSIRGLDHARYQI